eukprot:TRINITY_DN71711_c0_g1_i1.p1 TRINITY_DN71711_c0_g1~~TRINITY_DN71711_c0_g1_i1.p1  ORF type:complete len:614 (+),score=107.93 TRINITY_DN71711_c0_g1_i1:133-1974(+)
MVAVAPNNNVMPNSKDRPIPSVTSNGSPGQELRRTARESTRRSTTMPAMTEWVDGPGPGPGPKGPRSADGRSPARISSKQRYSTSSQNSNSPTQAGYALDDGLRRQIREDMVAVVQHEMKLLREWMKSRQAGFSASSASLPSLPALPGHPMSGDINDPLSLSVDVPGDDAKSAEDTEPKEDFNDFRRESIQSAIDKTKAQSRCKCFDGCGQKEVPNNFMSRFAESNPFVTFFSCLIAFNTLLIGVEADYNMRLYLVDASASPPPFFKIAGYVFTGFFALEIIVKLLGFRSAFWLGSQWRWNLFDFFLVAISFAQELVTTNVSFMRILRVFRMIRVLRIVRVLKVFHELRRMAASIISAMASLVWAFVLLLLIMYIFGIFFMQGAVNWISDNKDTHPDFVQLRDNLGEVYGSMPGTMYALIQAISGGADWGDVVSPLEAIDDTGSYTIMFIIYIVFVVFGVLNVLTGVFLESAAQVVDRDIITHVETKKQESFAREMTALFEELDDDGSGTLTWEELQEQLKNPRVRAYLNSQLLDSMDAHLFFKILQHEAGRNETDDISIEDFIVGCSRLKGQAKSMHVLNLDLEIGKIKTMQKAILSRVNSALSGKVFPLSD